MRNDQLGKISLVGIVRNNGCLHMQGGFKLEYIEMFLSIGNSIGSEHLKWNILGFSVIHRVGV